jgi:CrcB protein
MHRCVGLSHNRDVTLALVGLGGFFGAIARYGIDGWVSRVAGGSFPWGTLVVNLSGSFLLGVLFAAATERAVLPSEIRAPVMIGFIGAYTTFSTWMLESWRLVEDGAIVAAMANIGGSVVLGMGAVFLGLAVGRAI